MRYLLDTNIVSELSKSSPNPNVLKWFDDAEDADLFLSVITMGEIRKGIEQKRLTDPNRASRLEATYNTIRTDYRHRILPINEAIAEEWGRMCVRRG